MRKHIIMFVRFIATIFISRYRQEYIIYDNNFSLEPLVISSNYLYNNTFDGLNAFENNNYLLFNNYTNIENKTVNIVRIFHLKKKINL